MEIFTKDEQDRFRAATIEEARKKAWQARCHASWVADKFKKYESTVAEVVALIEGYEAEIKTLEGASDAHTRENRDKRKELRSQADSMTARLRREHKQGEELSKNMMGALGNADSNLDLAEFAATWTMGAEPEQEAADEGQQHADDGAPDTNDPGQFPDEGRDMP